MWSPWERERERERERCSEHMWVKKIDRNKETHNLSKIVARINTWFIYYPYVTFFFFFVNNLILGGGNFKLYASLLKKLWDVNQVTKRLVL